eukprot:223144_1
MNWFKHLIIPSLWYLILTINQLSSISSDLLCNEGNWTQTFGSWTFNTSYTPCSINIPPPGSTFSLYYDGSVSNSWTNYMITITMNIKKRDANSGVAFYSDKALGWQRNGYELRVAEPEQSAHLNIGRANRFDIYDITERYNFTFNNHSIEINTDYIITIIIHNYHILIYWDNILIFDYIDDIYRPNPGTVGLIGHVPTTYSNLIIKTGLLVTPLFNDYLNVNVVLDDSKQNNISDGKWYIKRTQADPLSNWDISLTLLSNEFGFESGINNSSITIAMDGSRITSELDMFYSFAVNNQYITFAHDFDGYFGTNTGQIGIFVYPSCGSPLSTGNASLLMESVQNSNHQRDDLAGGERLNWYQLSPNISGDNWPVSFTFINDDIDDTLTFKFESPTQSLSCQFTSSFDPNSDFKMYLCPDFGPEKCYIYSFEVSSYSAPTLSPTTDPTTHPTISTIQPTSNPTHNPIVAISEFDFMNGRLCDNLFENIALYYDESLTKCNDRCYELQANCAMINYFDHFKSNNDSRCYIFDKLCSVKVDGNNNTKSIIGYKIYNKQCIDYPNDWIDYIGDSCGYYELHAWCKNNTILTDENDFVDLIDIRYQLTAIDSCCECGGGSHIMDNVVFSIDNNWIDFEDDILCDWIDSDFTSQLTTNKTRLRNWNNIILYDLCTDLEDINCDVFIDSEFNHNDYNYSLYLCEQNTMEQINNFRFIFDIVVDIETQQYDIYINTEWFNLDPSSYSSNVNIHFNHSECAEVVINTNNTKHYGVHPCYVLDTFSPTSDPTSNPTNIPTSNPTNIPTSNPTNIPTSNPTNIPTSNPTNIPSSNPSQFPTKHPMSSPTNNPTNDPTTYPTNGPTMYPTMDPTNNPTNVPTN